MKYINTSLGRYAFTLVELLYVIIIIGIIVPCIFTIYNFIIKSDREINARENAIQQGYEFFERLNILMQDYTIDYEEYFNRQMVGCVNSGGELLTGENFKWNIGLSGYCTEFTTYGNGNSTDREERSYHIDTGYHDLYYCSSKSQQTPTGKPRVEESDNCGKYGRVQSYGQYAALFTDVNGGSSNMVGDGDDEEVGYLLNEDVNAIEDSNNIQELYLISKDGKSRLFFRRKLVKYDGENALFKIQMLRLKGFDAGREHKFQDSVGMGDRGIYDGKIDTWACDASMGFEPKNKYDDHNIGGAYSGYYLPSDVDDCWIDLTYGSTTVTARNISISPLGNADLYWARQGRQINDYIKILIVNGVYMPYYNNVPMAQSIGDFKVPLQTSFNMKDFYGK